MKNCFRTFCVVATLFLSGITTLHALTVTNSYQGVTASVTVNYNSGTGKLEWSRTNTDPANGWAPGMWVYTTTGQGGGNGSIVFDVAPAGASSASGEYTASAGQWFKVAARVSGPGSWWLQNPDQIQFFQAGAATYKVTVSLFNSRTVAVTYKVIQGATVVGQVTLQPGTGLIQTFVTTTADPVTVLELVPDLYKDGDTWVVVVGATTTSTVGTATPVSVPNGNPNPPAVVIPQAPNVPTNVTPNVAPEAKPVWVSTTVNNNPTGQVDLVTNAIFREGVDKLVQSLEGPAATPATFPESSTSTINATAGPVTGLVSKLPSVPNVFPTNIGSDSHFRFTLKFPPLTQEFPVDVNMAAYETPILFDRGLMLACMALLFFLLVVNAIRRAVA